MSGKYQRYPAYKASGVEWLGDMPEHWELTRVKFITQCFDGSRIPLNSQERGDMQGDIPYWGANNIVGYVNDFIFDEELILLGEDGAPFFDKTKDVAFNVSGKLWANNHIHVLKPEKTKIEFRFLKHALNCADFYLYISGSTRDKLNQYDMNQIQIRICPFSEQETIADFLDYETAKIDTLIEKQRRLIELFKEKRQAVISHAVTKGLNPNVPMKESGVEWLGEVPEHWEVCRFKFLVKESVSGPYGSSLTKAMYTLSGVRVYGQQQVIPDDFSTGDYYISEEKFEGMKRYEVFAGDVLISVMGTIGKVAVAPNGIERGIINPRLVKYKVREEEVLPHFVQASILSESSQLQLLLAAQGSTMDGLNMQIIGELSIAYPSIDEQIEILCEIRRRAERFDSLLEMAEQTVSLLQERRTALISAAVTGKIDVRNWQASKPSHKHIETNKDIAA